MHRDNLASCMLTLLCCRSKTHLLTLYFLDSGAYSNSKFDFFGFMHGTEYDWIHQVRCCVVLAHTGTHIAGTGSNRLVFGRILYVTCSASKTPVANILQYNSKDCTH
jgi:hypothetical protein